MTNLVRTCCYDIPHHLFSISQKRKNIWELQGLDDSGWTSQEKEVVSSFLEREKRDIRHLYGEVKYKQTCCSILQKLGGEEASGDKALPSPPTFP